MPRYSQTEGGEIIEHFDTLEELEARNKKISVEGSYLGFFLLSALGVALTYFVFHKLGFANASKWVKATAILFTAAPLGGIGYKYGELILGLIIWVFVALLAIGIASFAWSLL